VTFRADKTCFFGSSLTQSFKWGGAINIQKEDKNKHDGMFSQLKSVVFVPLHIIGLVAGLYLLATIGQLALMSLAFALLFLIFPVAATLLSFFVVHAALKRFHQCKFPRTISAIVAIVILASCVTFQVVTKRFTISEIIFGKAYWSETVPAEMQGRWVEVSDIVRSRNKRADVFKISARSLSTIQYIAYDNEPPKTHDYMDLAVEKRGSTITVHCPSELFGQRIYRLSPETSGDFIDITEITELGALYDYDKHKEYLGRFRRQ